jgi:hypothetical protein
MLDPSLRRDPKTMSLEEVTQFVCGFKVKLATLDMIDLLPYIDRARELCSSPGKRKEDGRPTWSAWALEYTGYHPDYLVRLFQTFQEDHHKAQKNPKLKPNWKQLCRDLCLCAMEIIEEPLTDFENLNAQIEGLTPARQQAWQLVAQAHSLGVFGKL